MSLNITVSIPLSIATSIHQSSDSETGNLDTATQQNILRSIVSAVKSLPDDSSTWGLDDEEAEAEDSHSHSHSPPEPEPEIRVSFSDRDTYMPARKSSVRHHRRGSSLKDTTLYTQPAIALQKPSGPDISFPSAQFAFEIRQGHARSLAVAAHGGVTTAELAMAIWQREGIPMREQRMYLGHEEIYNGRAHERDGVYELMRLRGKYVSDLQVWVIDELC